MAKAPKESIIIYTDIEDQLSLLSDAQTGVLFRAIIAYARDKEYTIDDQIVQMAFISIKHAIDINAKKYEEKIAARSLAGKKGAEKRWGKGGSKNGKAISEIANMADTDTDTVTDTSYDTVTEPTSEEDLIDGALSQDSRPSLSVVEQYCKERKSTVDPEVFVAYYDTHGWDTIKNWKSAIIL